MAKNNNLGDFLTDIANAIRTKKGTSGTIPAQDFSSEILSIPSGMTYEDYARTLYLGWGQSGIFPNAWQDSLEVDISEIEKNANATTQYGKLQYPNGELFGVIIPSGVSKIGNSGFYGWTSNNQPLVIPNSVTSIGTESFSEWTSNTHPLVIPDSVTSIDVHAFSNWTSNNQPLIIPNSVTSIGNSGFYGWTSNNQPLVIPNSVTMIDANAFSEWTSNNQPLIIPNSVTSIGNSVFSYWSSNNKLLVIPDSVTSIGSSAFSNWNANNQPLVIPESITSISGGVFINWSLVPYIEIKSIIPPSLASSNAFSGQNNAPIYVPDESLDDYKTATNWVRLSSRIKPISEKP